MVSFDSKEKLVGWLLVFIISTLIYGFSLAGSPIVVREMWNTRKINGKAIENEKTSLINLTIVMGIISLTIVYMFIMYHTISNGNAAFQETDFAKRVFSW